MRLDEVWLPPAPAPLGAYVPAVTVGRLVYVSGMLPLRPDGTLQTPGTVGVEVSIPQAQAALELAVKNGLATAKAHLGSLGRLERVVRLTVMLKTAPDFERHVEVVDPASAWLASLFGPRGHARLVYGVASTVRNACAVADLVLATTGATDE